VSRIFAQCIVCGKEGELLAEPEAPPVRAPTGWIALLAVHWPPGVDLGPLVLRVCGRCYLAALVASH
jgi:hypothetical protein